jgi:GNAT superfamily N-acetyltransferase
MTDPINAHISSVRAAQPFVDAERWTTTLTTRTGFSFDVRPASPGDEAGLAEFFTHVTPDELRFRFLSGLKEVGHDRLVAMTAIDHDRTENFLAVLPDGRILATGLLACDAAMQRGEVAISIRADYKNRGISWTLLEHIARYAEARGIRTLESIEARENRAAIELEQEMGFTAEALEGDPTLVRVVRRLG